MLIYGISRILQINCCSVPDINECDSSPCQNGGTCTDNVNGYTCDCVAGYTGTECQTGQEFGVLSPSHYIRFR